MPAAAGGQGEGARARRLLVLAPSGRDWNRHSARWAAKGWDVDGLRLYFKELSGVEKRGSEESHDIVDLYELPIVFTKSIIPDRITLFFKA